MSMSSGTALRGAVPIMLPVQTVFLSKVTVIVGKRLSKQPVQTICQFIRNTRRSNPWPSECLRRMKCTPQQYGALATRYFKEYALVSNQRASWLSGYFLIVSIAPMLLPVLHRLCRQLVFAIQTEHWIY